MSTDEAVFELLRSVAVTPGLSGVLLLDLDPAVLWSLGRWLADAISAVDGQRPRVILLGPWHTEDDLWVKVRLLGRRIETGPGLLVESPEEPSPVILVPNLAQASLAVQRAAVTLIDSDVASCQRYGFS